MSPTCNQSHCKCCNFINNYLNLTLILQTENCGRFWFQPTKYLKQIDEIYSELNNPNSDLESIGNEADIKVGQTLAAVYPSDGQRQVEYYRAKVIFIERNKDTKAPFKVRSTFQRK